MIGLQVAVSLRAKIAPVIIGDATDLTSFSLPVRRAFNGLLLVIIKAKKGQQGAIRLTVEANGLQEAATELQIIP